MIITTRHLFTIPGYTPRPGFCRNGSRAWMRAHGLDWKTFVRQGLDETTFTATDDVLGLDLVRWAHLYEQCDAGASAAGMDRALAAWRAWFAGGRRGR